MEKTLTRVVLVLCVLAFAGAATAQEAVPTPPAPPSPTASAALQAPAKQAMKMIAAEDLQWKDAPGATGIHSAVLWGDPTKGAHAAFDKFDAGLQVPLHTHTQALRGIVISGTMIETPEGQPSKELGPGSFLYIPGGAPHSTACKAGADCVVFRQQPGPFDVVMAAVPPPPPPPAK